jgi:3-methyladenine DNA glycosylase AlkC
VTAAPMGIEPDAAYDVGIPLLDRLFADPTRYVTRSVANHVNDIFKKDPRLPLDTLERWRGSGYQRPPEMGYVIRHAARTLVRADHPRALHVVNSSLVGGQQAHADAALNT